jgi:hypothetical protein
MTGMKRKRDSLASGLVVSCRSTAIFFLTSVLALLFDVTSAGPGPLTAFPSADFFAGLLALRATAELDVFELLADIDSGEVAVHFSRAVALAFDLKSGREMLEINAGTGLVDFLSAAAGATDEFLEQVVLMDLELGHAFLQRGFFLGRDHRFFMAAR